MQVLNYNHKNFLAAHFQGGCHISFIPLCDWFNSQKIELPDNVSIVTVANNPERCMLIKQLERNGMHYENDAELGGEWSNTLKPKYIRKSLDKVKTEYVLILDAGDVLFTQSPTDIVERFKQYERKLIFGATKSNHPNELIDKIWGRDFRGKFRYLNAGTCFGYTEYCRQFYKQADYLIWANELDNPTNSEQLIIRHVFKDITDEVDFDYKCELFQTFGKTACTLIDGSNEVYQIT